MNDSQSSNKTLIIFFFSILLVGIGFSIILPILPLYAKSLGASGFQLGLITTCYAVCQFIFAPFWGALSDKVGRKPVLLLGMFGFAVTFGLFAIASSIPMLYIARIAGGIFSSAAMPTSLAYIADCTTTEKRGSRMGLVGASIGAGNIFGPALGGMLCDISLSFPFVVSGFLAVLNFLAVAIFVKESLPAENRKNELKYKRPSLLEGLKTPLAVLLIVMMMVSISETTHQWIFALFGEGKLFLNAQQIGWAFTGAGIASVLVQGFLVGVFIGWLGEEKTAKLGMLVVMLSFALLLLAGNYVVVLAAMAIAAFGLGLIRPSLFAAVSRRTTIEQGKTMGILQGYDSLGRGIGPPLGGFMLDVNLNYGYLEAILLMGLAFLTLSLMADKNVGKSGEDTNAESAG